MQGFSWNHRLIISFCILIIHLAGDKEYDYGRRSIGDKWSFISDLSAPLLLNIKNDHFLFIGKCIGETGVAAFYNVGQI